MTRAAWAAVVPAALAVRCGPPPAPLDAAAEREDERLILEAGRAERGPQPGPKGKTAPPPTRNPDDD